MPNIPPAVLLFTDVDGCLLNKHDYSYADALPALERAKSLGVPIILASSKTASELTRLSDELHLEQAPLICENGARILWRGSQFGEDRSTVGGVHRNQILAQLKHCSNAFRFRSFEDLQLEGVMQATDLPEDRAIDAMAREGTEPLLWDDDPARIDEFRATLTAEGLTLTQGGRFWHVAGGMTKGLAMTDVVSEFVRRTGGQTPTIAIGDSPIDQSMLDCADYPVGIPWRDGTCNVSIPSHGVRATVAGAAGWSECVKLLLDRIDATT